MDKKEIQHFINSPEVNKSTAPELKLYRPKINYFVAGVYILLHFVFGFLILALWNLLNGKDFLESIKIFDRSLIIIVLVLFFLTARFTMIWFVKLYQRYAKSETRLRCSMTPTCSAYAILALRKYGAIVGGIKAIKRIVGCNPYGEIDYP